MATTGKTREKFQLSQEQIDQYREKGYCVVPDVLTEEEIEMYKKRAREIALGDIPEKAKKRVIKDVRVAKGIIPAPEDPEKGLWKMMNPDRFDQTFRDYLQTPKLLDAVENLIGEDLVAFLLMVIYKPPHIEAVHPYHQDSFYFRFGPHDKIVATWIPLDLATGDNGTLRVIPGSHKGEVIEHEMPESVTNAYSFEAKGYDEDPTEEVLEVQPGHAVLFHSRLLHKTGGNSTDGHRRVLTVHMCSAKCKKFDADAAMPELGFRLVRGQNYPDCVLPPGTLALEYGRKD